MSCPDLFKNSPGAFFVPKECAECKLLNTERTSVRGIDLYFCRNLDANATLEARLITIIDGDTLVVQLGQKEKVRLLGIDAPEKTYGEHAARQCQVLNVDPGTLQVLAKLSTIHLWGLCPSGSIVTLQTTSLVRDDNYRVLAGAFIGEKCVNRCMVEDGYALAYQGSSDWEDYAALQQTAMSERRGIWGACAEPFYPATTRSFHRPGCYYARWARSKFQTSQEALAAGLNACSACIPDYSY